MQNPMEGELWKVNFLKVVCCSHVIKNHIQTPTTHICRGYSLAEAFGELTEVDLQPYLKTISGSQLIFPLDEFVPE